MSLESKALQFDTAVPATADPAIAGVVTCVACQQTIADEYFDINGQAVCESCRQQVALQAETPKGFGVLGRATLFGLGAAIAGAILYYAVIAITQLEIGLVAIAIGYMVGYAVRTGAHDRGGRRFQVLAVVLTYWAVGLAYTPVLFQAMKQQQTQQAPASTTPESSEPAAAASESAEEPVTAGTFALAIGFLFALSFALPVLTVFSSLPGGLLSAAIIAFGMQQAWRMTAAPDLVISGPYRVASKLAS